MLNQLFSKSPDWTGLVLSGKVPLGADYVNSYRQKQLVSYFLFSICKNSFQIVVVVLKVTYYLSVLFCLQNLSQVTSALWAMWCFPPALQLLADWASSHSRGWSQVHLLKQLKQAILGCKLSSPPLMISHPSSSSCHCVSAASRRHPENIQSCTAVFTCFPWTPSLDCLIILSWLVWWLTFAFLYHLYNQSDKASLNSSSG